MKWGLFTEKLTVMARDNGSNIVAACNMWGIHHIGCIGHSLHLVVNPFLQKKKEEEDSNGEENDDNYDIGVDNDVVSFNDDKSEDLLSDIDFVCNVWKTVSDIRKIAVYIKNSTMAKEKLQLFEAAARTGRSDVATNDANSPLLTLVLDVATRWNSAYDMLTKMWRHKDSITSFLNFLKTAAGKSEFGRKKLPTLSEMQWASMEGLCVLLKPFYELTKVLSGEKYSTLVVAFPLLRMVKSILSNRNMFIGDSDNVHMKKQINVFREKYEGEDFYQQTVQNLDACREVLLQSFTSRFRGLSYDIMWIGYLDPRQKDMLHLKDDKRTQARQYFIQQVLNLIKDSKQPEVLRLSEGSDSDSENDLDMMSMFASSKRQKVSHVQHDERDIENEALRCAENEVQSYLLASNGVGRKTDIFAWWIKSKASFPNVAALARQWLSCPATSVASERVFSSCGLVQTAKRSRLLGKNIRNQVMIQKNLSSLNISMADVVAEW